MGKQSWEYEKIKLIPVIKLNDRIDIYLNVKNVVRKIEIFL